MGTLPIFVAVCVGDPPVIGTFPTKRDSNPNFDVTFLVSLNDLLRSQVVSDISMMTLSNGSISRVTGHLYRGFPAQRPVTRSFDVFFDLRLDKRLSKQS